MACKHVVAGVAVAAALWAGAAATDAAAAVQVQQFNRCPGMLSGLQALVDRLEVQSKTPGVAGASKTFYKPTGLTALGTQPLEFQADFQKDAVTGVYVTLPGNFKQYAAALQEHYGAAMQCDADRCRWMRTERVPSGTLIYVYLAQEMANGGKNTTFSCSYFR